MTFEQSSHYNQDDSTELAPDEELEMMLAETDATERVLAFLDGSKRVAIRDGEMTIDAEDIRRELVARLQQQGASWETMEAAHNILIALIVANDTRLLEGVSPRQKMQRPQERVASPPIEVANLAERVRAFVGSEASIRRYPSVDEVTAHIVAAESDDLPLTVEWLMSLRSMVHKIIISLGREDAAP